MSPVLTRLHHRIEYSQQLSHAGRQRQLLWLPCRQQPDAGLGSEAVYGGIAHDGL